MITSSEWEVMRVLWTMEEIGSQEISRILSQKQDWSESTVKTLLGRLVEKDLVATRREGRRYLYRPLISEDMANRNRVESELKKICQTKQFSVLTDLLQDLPMTRQDIEQLREFLDQKVPVQEVTCNCIPGQCHCKEDL